MGQTKGGEEVEGEADQAGYEAKGQTNGVGRVK
jgi:hypothetical protein